MHAKEQHFEDVHIPAPIREGIILRREGGVVMTNVPHRVVWHSPSGFEWGYSGSGPADLALNAVEAALVELGFTGPREKCFDGDAFTASVRLHQAFKAAFISGIEHAGGKIEWAEIEEFVRGSLDSIEKKFRLAHVEDGFGPTGEAIPDGVDPFEVWIGKLPK